MNVITATTDADHRIPDAFTPLEAYSYTFSIRCNASSNVLVNPTVQIEREGQEYRVTSIALNGGSFSDWGWFTRAARAATLEGLKELIDTYIAAHDAELEASSQTLRADHSAYMAYRTDHDAWKAEQLARVELVLIEDIATTPMGIVALVSDNQIHAEVRVVEDAWARIGEVSMYRVYVDGPSFQVSDRRVDRRVKPGGRTRAIRSFSRPEPQRTYLTQRT